MSELPRRLFRAWATWSSLALACCAAWQAPADVGDAELRGRAVSAEQRDVRVSAAVLGTVDVRRMLGADLDKIHVQPVWIELQNGTSQPLWLLRSGVDPDYYSPLEVAWSLHTVFGGDANARIDDHFDKLALKSPINPGTARAGILFTNPERRTKLLNLDLFGRRTLIPFTLFVPVPNEAASALFQYPQTQVTDYVDLADVRAALERFPCCATDADGMEQGDPLNAAFVGEFADIGAAVVRRDYRRDARANDMLQQVFGRAPDAVLRKEAQAGSPSTTLRAWLAPIRFEGRSIYLVQVGRPAGGRFASLDATAPVLHADVDESRNLLILDMMYSGGVEKLGFVTGGGEASETQPRSTFYGVRYHTDGLRAVLFFAKRPLSLADVQFLNWVPYLERRASDARGAAELAQRLPRHGPSCDGSCYACIGGGGLSGLGGCIGRGGSSTCGGSSGSGCLGGFPGLGFSR
jgi:hypothetical protein